MSLWFTKTVSCPNVLLLLLLFLMMLSLTGKIPCPQFSRISQPLKTETGKAKRSYDSNQNKKIPKSHYLLKFPLTLKIVQCLSGWERLQRGCHYDEIQRQISLNIWRKRRGEMQIKHVLYAYEENKRNDIPYKVTQIQKKLKVLCSYT